MLRALDLFAGIGAFSGGLHRTGGFETVAACEKAAWKRLILAEMLPGVPIYPDVTQLTGRQVLDDIGPIDIVVGSPPCTDASSANTAGRGVDGDETRLFFEAVRLVGEIGPAWLILENVDRLRTRGADRVLDALERQAYACWPVVVGALHAGAPHIRKRVWFVGFSADAHQERVRQQQGRRGRPDRQGAVVAGVQTDAGLHPADADGHGRQHAGRRRQRGDLSAAAGVPADGARDRRGAGRPGRPDPGGAGQSEQALFEPGGGRPEHHPDAARDRRNSGAPAGPAGRPGRQPDGAATADADGAETGRRHSDGRWGAGAGEAAGGRDPADADRAGPSLWESLGGDHAAQLAALERDVGPTIHQWAGGLGRYLRVADGLPAATARMLMSAAGDAVVESVVEVIAQAVLDADRAWRDGRGVGR